MYLHEPRGAHTESEVHLMITTLQKADPPTRTRERDLPVMRQQRKAVVSVKNPHQRLMGAHHLDIGLCQALPADLVVANGISQGWEAISRMEDGQN
jgi:hypothetical protein